MTSAVLKCRGLLAALTLFDWGKGGPLFYFVQDARWKPGVYDTTLVGYNGPSVLTVTAVPEPSSWVLMALGMLSAMGFRRSRAGRVWGFILGWSAMTPY